MKNHTKIGLATNYAGGTRTVSATGLGTVNQNGFGNDYLAFNGFTFNNGGTASLSGSFTNGFSGTYAMNGY